MNSISQRILIGVVACILVSASYVGAADNVTEALPIEALRRLSKGRLVWFSTIQMELLISTPALRGKLSRRLPSELAVQKVLPLRKGLVGNSRM